MGEAVVLQADGGLPEAEFALFDAGDIELHATEPGSIREIGYRTTVAEARARLAEAGFTPAVAEQVASAMKHAIGKAYARGAAARCIVDRLDAVELLESRAFDAASALYVGTWLDLGALAADLGVLRATTMLRAAYLAASLAEADADEHVFLSTSELSTKRRPGERTFRRVTLGDPRTLLDAIAALKPRSRARGAEGTPESGPNRRDIVGWLRERARQAPAARERLRSAEVALGARDAPTRGPLAETALWTVEAKLARGETAGVPEQIDAIERRRGRVPGSIYLRARVALMTRSEEPRSIAARISELSTSMASFHELALLAAQAWLAAGDARRARAFARDLLENTGADDVLRIQAHEVLEAAGESSAAIAAPAPPLPPAAPREGEPPSTPIQPHAIVSVEPGAAGHARPPSDAPTPRSPEARDPGDVVIPRPPLAPSGSDLQAIRTQPALPMPRTSTRPGFPAAPARPSSAMRTLPPGTSLPPYRVEPRGERPWTVPPPAEVELERVETLTLPSGGEGDPPALDETPRSAAAARLHCTFLARQLGRELRERYGVEVRTDVEGLETAQRYLREEFVDGRVRTPAEMRSVMRQGGFVGELLARRLGARWVDLESPEAGRWAMLVPSRSRPDEVARVWPFARVLRFVAMGHKERDLVSYYLELEARAR